MASVMAGNLYGQLEAHFPADRTRTFARLPDDAVLSYAGLESSSSRYAYALRALNVGPGDRVAVQVEKCIEMLILYLACLRAGAIFLPLNPAYTPVELDHFLRDSEPSLFVCAPESADALREAAEEAGVARLETLAPDGAGTLAALARSSPADFETVSREADDLAAILYTSGTTGRSKGAMLTHENLASNAFTLRDCWRFGPDDVLLHALPIFHTHGLFVAVNVVLAAGASLIFLPRFDLDAVLRALPGATVMMGVPTFYVRLLADPRFTRESAAHMRLFVSGSAPLSADTHRAFLERTGHAILERYGMTETNMNTSNPYEGDRIAGTVGLPLPGVDIRIADQETGRPLPRGEVGVIEISGPNVFKGYWRAPEKTAAEFRGGWFVSGDLGRIDERGYVSILGRSRDLIISGGHNIYPAEIEAALDELPQVAESAVIGVPHPDLGEAALAVIVPRDPGFSDGDALGAALAGRLARFKQPRRYAFVAELPRNAMGKVQKSALRALFEKSFAPD
jgi:malonyl-CoA/methylmalonyl-CoA synthetase